MRSVVFSLMSFASASIITFPFRPHPHQVAGHDGLLISSHGTICKPTTPTEIEFYQAAQSHPIRELIPRFYGIHKLPDELNERFMYCVEMENLVGGYEKPNIIDIKLGSVLYDGHASDEKKSRLERAALETTSGSLALRITGMKVWNPAHENYDKYDKAFGKALTTETFLNGLLKFFPEHHCLTARASIISAIQAEVNNMYEKMSQWKLSLMMYSSSLLITYEGSPEIINCNMNDLNVRVKLIDFAHSYFENRLPESGAVNGLYNLKTLLDNALNAII